MQRRKFLIGMGSLAAGSAAAMGTGAFATEASRDFKLNVAGDANGMVGLTAGDTPLVYTEETNAGYDILKIDADNIDAEGFNDQAKTFIRKAFSISNQYSSEGSLYIWFDAGNDPRTAASVDNDELRFDANGQQILNAAQRQTSDLNYIELGAGNGVWIDIIVDLVRGYGVEAGRGVKETLTGGSGNLTLYAQSEEPDADWEPSDWAP